jgi:hypothetical protein
MAEDVGRLLMRAGWQASDYHEVAADEEQRQAIRRWPLLASVTRALEAAAPAGTGPAAEDRSSPGVDR